MRKVFIPVDFGVIPMFRYFNNDWTVTNNISEASLVQFTGGADIFPGRYNRPRHKTMYLSPEREYIEMDAYHYAVEHSIPMAGICRGAQLLNALCGGDMWQHVNGHGTSHVAFNLRTEKYVKVTSCHHQCMDVSSEAEVVLHASRASFLSRMNLDMTEEVVDENIPPQVEACFYKNRGVFCWQGHPEWEDNPSLYFEFLEELFK